MKVLNTFAAGFAISALMAMTALSGAPDAAAQGRTIWEGFHFGVHGGGADHDFNIGQTAPALPLVTIRDSADGAVAGIVYGTSWRRGQWVYGTDSDWSWMDADTGLNVTTGPRLATARSATVGIDHVFTTRGRAGYLFGPNVLVYGTAGVAFTKAKATGSLIAGGSQSKRLTGFVYGIGLEATFSNRWFGRIEYLRTDYGDKKFTEVGGGTFNIDLDSDVVRGVIGYRFDWSPFDILNGG